MKKLYLEVSEEQLAALSPQGREAVLRLARSQNPEPTDHRTPNQRFEDGCKKGPSRAEMQAKVAKFVGPDGLTVRQPSNLKPPQGR